jgi:hypothetical protein
MRQNIDIAEVEAATKIRTKYLRALENEEFALLPGNTFVKTFLRTYAEYLGLDAQLLIEEYRVEHEPRGEGELQPYVSPSSRRRQQERRQAGRRRPRPSSGPPGLGTIVVVIVAVVLVIFAILGLTGGGNGGGSGQQASTTPTKKKATGNANKPSKKRKTKPTVVRLRVIPPPTGTYMCIDRGEGTPPIFNRTTADPQRFRGKRLRINLGKPSTRVVVNGKRVSIPDGANPVGFEFTPTRTKPLPLGQRPCA